MSIKKEQDSIGEIIRKAIKNEIAKIHTSIPAEITKINLLEKTVEVKPLIREKNLLNEFVELPIIPNVPIRFTQTTKALISVPLEIGDTGVIVFSERSIGNWQQEGGIQNPEDNRKFNIKDCYFSPDLVKNSDGKTLTDELQIILNNANIKIKQNGEINIENSAGSIMIDIAGNMTLENTKIKLGSSAVEKAVLGNTLQTLINAFISTYNGHTHTANGTPPSQNATPLNGTELSNKVVIE